MVGAHVLPMPREVEQLPHDAGHALDLGDDDLRIGDGRLALRLVASDHLGAPRDHIEGRAELVRDSRREFAHGGEPIGVPELFERCDLRLRRGVSLCLQRAKLLGHSIERIGELTELVALTQRDGIREVTTADACDAREESVHGPLDEEPAGRREHGEADGDEEQGHVDRAHHGVVHVLLFGGERLFDGEHAPFRPERQGQRAGQVPPALGALEARRGDEVVPRGNSDRVVSSPSDERAVGLQIRVGDELRGGVRARLLGRSGRDDRERVGDRRVIADHVRLEDRYLPQHPQVRVTGVHDGHRERDRDRELPSETVLHVRRDDRSCVRAGARALGRAREVHHRGAHVVDVEGLAEEARGARIRRLDLGVLVAETRDQDERERPTPVADEARDVEAGSVGHADVGDDEHGLALLGLEIEERLNQRPSAAGFLDLVSIRAKGIGQERAHLGVVVCDEDARSGSGSRLHGHLTVRQCSVRARWNRCGFPRDASGSGAEWDSVRGGREFCPVARFARGVYSGVVRLLLLLLVACGPPVALGIDAGGEDAAPVDASDVAVDAPVDAAPDTRRDAAPAVAPEDLEGFVRFHMEAGALPGMAIGLVARGEVVHVSTYGFANVADAIPVAEDTAFPVASISKPFVLASVMRRVEAGELDLDEAVADALPEFPLAHPEFPDAVITPRMLITHTSGAEDDFITLGSLVTESDPVVSLEAFSRGYFLPGGEYYEAGNFGPEPGTRRVYCNAGYGLLGYLVADAADEDFRVLNQREVIDALGLSAGWFTSDLDPATLAIPYSTSRGDFNANPHIDQANYPAGTLRASLRDLLTFARLWLGGGEVDGVRVLSEESVAEVFTAPFPDVAASQLLAFSRHRYGTHVYAAQSGSTLGGSAQFLLRPEDGAAIVLLTNSDAYIRSRVGRPEGADAIEAIVVRLDAELDAL